MKPDVISNFNSIISSPLDTNGGTMLLGDRTLVGIGAVDTQTGWGKEITTPVFT